MIYLFAVWFSLTWGVIIKVYTSEIQPAETRAAATSLAQSMNWISNFIIAFMTPVFLANSSYGAYMFFGACNALTVLVCFLFMPETRGKSLEDIDYSFTKKLPLPIPQGRKEGRMYLISSMLIDYRR